MVDFINSFKKSSSPDPPIRMMPYLGLQHYARASISYTYSGLMFFIMKQISHSQIYSNLAIKIPFGNQLNVAWLNFKTVHGKTDTNAFPTAFCFSEQLDGGKSKSSFY